MADSNVLDISDLLARLAEEVDEALALIARPVKALAEPANDAGPLTEDVPQAA